MKSLKFRKTLSRLILNRTKKSTWRLFDDKDITVGDIVSFLIWESGEEFAKVRITFVKETAFGNLKKDDFEGHEKFVSDEEMYKLYSEYYRRKVDKCSIVKIIHFELI